MTTQNSQILISGNNENLLNFLLHHKDPHLQFVNDKKSPFHALIVDLTQSLENISANLIKSYQEAQLEKAKFVLILIFNQTITHDQIVYFQKILDGFTEGRPLHRIIITTDLYATSSKFPISRLEQTIFESLSQNKITISKKGSKRLYPLNIDDFLTALKAVLFLNHTAGQTFYLLGDGITDIEFAYLLKTKAEQQGLSDFEINAIEKDYTENTLNHLSLKTRAQLNWNPVFEIEDSILSIDSSGIAPSPNHKSKLSNFSLKNIFSKKKVKTETYSFKSLYKKILIKAVLIGFILETVLLLTITASSLLLYTQLRNSLETSIKGDSPRSSLQLQRSHRTLNVVMQTISTQRPFLSLISPKILQKIDNTVLFVNYFQTTLENINQSLTLIESLRLSLGSQGNISYQSLSLALSANISQIYTSLNQIKLITQNNRLPELVSRYITKQGIMDQIGSIESNIEKTIPLVELLPEILSDQSPTNISLIIQKDDYNSPLGGNISYIHHLTIDKGQLVSQKTFYPSDLENPNDKNKINITPSYPLYAQEISNRIYRSSGLTSDFIITLPETLFNSNHSTLEESTSTYITSVFQRQITLEDLITKYSYLTQNNRLMIYATSPSLQHKILSQEYSHAQINRPCHPLLEVTTCLQETSLFFLASAEKADIATTHQIELQAPITHKYTSIIKNQINNPKIYLLLTSPANILQATLNGLPISLKDTTKNTFFGIDYFEIKLPDSLPENSKIETTVISNNSIPSDDSFGYTITEAQTSPIHNQAKTINIIYPKSHKPTQVTSKPNYNSEGLVITTPDSAFTFAVSFTKEPSE